METHREDTDMHSVAAPIVQAVTKALQPLTIMNAEYQLVGETDPRRADEARVTYGTLEIYRSVPGADPRITAVYGAGQWVYARPTQE